MARQHRARRPGIKHGHQHDGSVTDTYSARDAAAVIGRSERLVRKLADEGRLEIVSRDPLRVSQESVHRERSKRKAKPKPKPDGSGALSGEQLEQIITKAVAAAVAEIVPRMLETRDAVEDRLAAELASAQQQIEQLRRDLDAERSRPGIRLPEVGWPFRR
jgi:hypothetical protein